MERDESFDPASELAELDAATAGYAKAAPGESLYHLALGVALGLVVVAQGLSSPWGWVLPIVALLMIPLLIAWWRRAHGWWVSGYAPGRTRWVVAAMAAVFAVLFFVSFTMDSVWVSVSAGVVTAAVTSGLGFVWMVVWRRGLTVGAQA